MKNAILVSAGYPLHWYVNMTMVGGLFDDNDDVDGRETVTKLADSQCKQVQRVTTKLQDKIPPTTLYRWSKRTPVVR